MNATSLMRHGGHRHPVAWLLLGGALLGSLDAAFAFVFWSPAGLTLGRLFQSIAAGLLGQASYQGGTATAWLGAGLHFAIATIMVLVCHGIARRQPGVIRRPVSYGIVYGLLLYATMNFVVLPLSAAGMPTFDNLPWVAWSVAMHALFGVICTWSARMALR